ncbi:hypothetical protein DIPPA_01285 [Diplonema papillatum]|nr:hypothetical protein DIPPA_01285 [Diplonema papillatum]
MQIFLLAAALSAARVQADFDCSFNATYPKQYVAYKVAPSEVPVIDGKLDDKVWQDVPWTDYFIDIANDVVPRFDTRAKMRWDDDWLYIGAELHEPQIWANLTADEVVIFNDNDFEIFVDADGSNHYYKEFEMNARNHTWNLCLDKPYLDGGYENSTRVFGSKGFTMQPPLTCGTFVNGGLNDPTVKNYYWSVEVRLPNSGLQYNQTRPLDPRFWRINFSRVEWIVTVVNNVYQKIPNVAEDNWTWSNMSIVDMHLPSRWGIMQRSNNTNPAAQPESPIHYSQWSIREMAMGIYNAERAYFANTTHYTASLDALAPFSTVPLTGLCLAQLPSISLQGSGFLAVVEDSTMVASVTDDNFLQVRYK